MSRRARLTVAGGVALASLIGIAVISVGFLSRGHSRAALPLYYLDRDAVAPFRGYRETKIDFGGSCLRVAVADTATLRQRGLRGHGDLRPYAGMLFVSSDDSDVAFTMAGLSVPLDIRWYTGGGAFLQRAAMAPCPDRAAAHCPKYTSRRPYRFALETPRGAPAPGALSPCT